MEQEIAGLQPLRSLRATAGHLPFDLFEQWRAKGSVIWDEGMGSWIVLDFETCKYIEDNEAIFPNPYRFGDPELVEIMGGPNITSMQDDEHHRMRHFHLKLLSPVAVKNYRSDFILPILEFLFAAIEGKGHADLASDLADQLPPRLTAALFGMPWQDDALVNDLLTLNGTIMTWISLRETGDEVVIRNARDASDQLNALILPYIQLRRREPGTDFVSRVIIDGPGFYDNLSDQQISAMCRVLLLAASDTTVHAIANTLYLILTEPHVREALEADLDGKIDAVVEEALRIYGSVQFQIRHALDDCEVGGASIKKNDSIILHHAAANRDPNKYRCPQDTDLARRPLKEHLAFGIGPRICPGASLARAEIRDAVKMVLARLPNVRLDPSAEPPHFDGFFTRSWRPLNVVFD